MSVSAAVPIPAFDVVETNEPSERLVGVRQRLTGPRETIEKVFLEMGQELLDCTRLLGAVSAAHRGIPDELESEAFDDVGKTLASIRGDVQRMSSVRSQETDCLDRLTVMARAASTPLHDLRKTVRTIMLVAVNACVAAATTKGDERELDVFTADVRALTQSVEKTVDSFVEAYGRFARDLAAARSASTAFSERHGATMAGISGRLTAHLDYLSDYRRAATAAADEHTTLAGQIRSRVAQAVTALQIGDTTRQRVEHVEEALALLQERNPDVSPPPDSHGNTLSAAVKLLGAQLDETGVHFEREIAALARSLQDLAEDADRVLDAGNRQAATAFSDGEAALASIIDDIAEIRTLFRDFANTRAGMETIARDVARSVEVMVDRLAAIADIEQQIRLLSFNTAVQCAKLGEDGRALRVIAQSLRDIVGETVTASSAILDTMANAADMARALIEGDAAGLAGRVASLEEGAGGAIDLLGQISGRLRAHVSAMKAVGPQAVNQLHDAAYHADGQRSLAARLQAARADLLALAPREADLSNLDVDFFASLRKRYTMDSERRIHDGFLGMSAEAAAPEGSIGTADASLDDILF